MDEMELNEKAHSEAVSNSHGFISKIGSHITGFIFEYGELMYKKGYKDAQETKQIGKGDENNGKDN